MNADMHGWTVGDLLDELSKHPRNLPVSIKFEPHHWDLMFAVRPLGEDGNEMIGLVASSAIVDDYGTAPGMPTA